MIIIKCFPHFPGEWGKIYFPFLIPQLFKLSRERRSLQKTNKAKRTQVEEKGIRSIYCCCKIIYIDWQLKLFAQKKHIIHLIIFFAISLLTVHRNFHLKSSEGNEEKERFPLWNCVIFLRMALCFWCVAYLKQAEAE